MARPAPSTDDAAQADWLAQVAARGDAAAGALTRLMNAYERRIRGFFFHRGADLDDVEDLLQEVFATVFEKAADFRGGAASAWIWAIARHRWIDLLRDPERRRRTLRGKAANPDGEVTVEDLEAPPVAGAVDDCVRGGWARFEARYPDAADDLLLRDLLGWDVPELAAHIQRSEGATRVHLSDLRKKVRDFLQDCLDLLKAPR